MMRGIKLLIGCVVLLGTIASRVNAGVITDGDFSSFAFNSTSGSSPPGTATVTQELTGGNPGARLNVTTNTLSGQSALGTAVKTDYVTTAALEGASFTLSLDVLSGPGSFGQGQGIALLVEQDGSIYGRSLGITSHPLNFDTVTFSSTFDSSSFALLIGSGPATADFSGGVATRFGFSASNSSSGQLTQYYDNFRVESEAIGEVPEPTSLAIFGLGGLGLVAGGIRRRKQKQA